MRGGDCGVVFGEGQIYSEISVENQGADTG